MDIRDVHKVWLDGNLLPITPSKITYEYEDRTEVHTMVDGNTLTIGRRDGPVTISFEFTDPDLDNKYPYMNVGGRHGDWSDVFWIWKRYQYPFELSIKREHAHLNVCMYVLLKDWSFVEDAEKSNDFIYNVTLIEYCPQTNMEINADLQHHLQKNRVQQGWRAGRI